MCQRPATAMATNQTSVIGPKKRRDPRGAARLHREQHDQDHDGQRHDVGIERRRHDLEAFDRRQHRERRRDHRVAVEQRAADDAEQHQRAGALPMRVLRQRHQRQRAALAVVVGAQQDDDVFERDDDDQRPQDQRQHAEHGLAGRRAVGADRGVHRLAEARRAGWCRCRHRRRRCCRASAARSRLRAAPLPCAATPRRRGTRRSGLMGCSSGCEIRSVLLHCNNARSALIWPGRRGQHRKPRRRIPAMRKNRCRGRPSPIAR